LGQVLDPGRPDRSNVRVLDVGPGNTFGGVGEAINFRSSCANDFTTRTPFTFSSTIVATSAKRAWVIQEIGNMTGAS